MTKTDNIVVDAAKAAALIKSTAESTATALNIQYMQKDISEIKEGIKSLITTQDGKIEELEKKIESQGRTLNYGLGALGVLTFVIPLLMKFFIK